MYSKYQNIIPWYIVQTVEKKICSCTEIPGIPGKSNVVYEHDEIWSIQLGFTSSDLSKS